MKRQQSSTPFEVDELTEYEKMIQKNKAEKDAFLKSIKIDDVKDNLKAAIKNLKPRRQKSKRPLEALPSRERIRRLAKVEVDLSEAAVEARALGQKVVSKSEKAEERRKREAEFAERQHKRRCRQAFEARIDEMHSLIKKRCFGLKFFRTLFIQRMQDLMGESPRPIDNDLNAVPAPGSAEESLVVERCALAGMYTQCAEPPRHVVIDEDISLAIKNLHQHNLNSLDYQQLKERLNEEIKSRSHSVVASRASLRREAKVNVNLSEEALEARAVGQAADETEKVEPHLEDS